METQEKLNKAIELLNEVYVELNKSNKDLYEPVKTKHLVIYYCKGEIPRGKNSPYKLQYINKNGIFGKRHIGWYRTQEEAIMAAKDHEQKIALLHL